ncbi:hypothetical protein GGX14DRAFT_475363 [Mycena pura]|uniref:Myb/SANT-like domain-containing protein n=1 Tax=Mycena pura TaxID=153505 RepID=A0AAD6Y5J0_9AGAR|nr:hypothetical protein GGX14DRAFT_475363 [Mycena pura]
MVTIRPIIRASYAFRSLALSRPAFSCPPRAHWSVADDAVLVRAMRDAKDAGFQSDSGWKPQTWARVALALANSPGVPKVSEKCQDRFGTLKQSYREVRTLLGLSGFGWNEGLKIVTASAEVWDAYLEVRHTSSTVTWHPFSLTMHRPTRK